MAAVKKGTRLTDTPKDYMLRVRMDADTLEKLDAVCTEKKASRSAVVREGIEQQYASIKK